jgi:hypothetical protein
MASIAGVASRPSIATSTRPRTEAMPRSAKALSTACSTGSCNNRVDAGGRVRVTTAPFSLTTTSK